MFGIEEIIISEASLCVCEIKTDPKISLNSCSLSLV